MLPFEPTYFQVFFVALHRCCNNPWRFMQDEIAHVWWWRSILLPILGMLKTRIECVDEKQGNRIWTTNTIFLSASHSHSSRIKLQNPINFCNLKNNENILRIFGERLHSYLLCFVLQKPTIASSVTNKMKYYSRKNR